jgi:signal transduction histidine kinase
MNPAYILRQVMDEYGDLYGIKGKITSFKLMNPNNAPDAWEADALRKFDQGVKEVFEFTEMNGAPYLRLMQPMITQRGCLKCHAFQGYKVGDVRGGVGVAVPMQPYIRAMNDKLRIERWSYGLVWLVGCGGILALFFQVRRRLELQQRSEAALRSQSEALERANKELMRFSEVSAHHLQEPARRMSSYAQRLRKHLGPQLDDEETRTDLEFIEQGAIRLRSLVRDIELYLAASSPRGAVGPQDVRALVGEIIKDFQPRLEETGAKLEIGELPVAVLDKSRLEDIFALLLDNALTYRRPHIAPEISVSGERVGAVSRFRIEDNGPGIPEEYRGRVQEIFERLGTPREGSTGIGLSIVRRIVESRQGRLVIEASSSGGAALIFDLPDVVQAPVIQQE